MGIAVRSRSTRALFPRSPRALRSVVLACALLACAGGSTAQAQGSRGWSTHGTKILAPGGGEFVINGINWYGFETTTYVAHGLWSRDIPFILDQVKQLGYNALRIPFSNEMWENNPPPAGGQASGCPSCAGLRSRDVLATIVNYAGSIGLHVIFDNHRSTAGNSAEEDGLWYTRGYSERAWIDDWASVQAWTHGILQTLGARDTVAVEMYASDGFPIVLGFDLRNEPHTPSGRYVGGATWGSGDGIDPVTNPNPNPFAPACVASSSCHDWRLAAERAASTVLGQAERNGWEYPLIFVEGIGQYPAPGGTAETGPFENYWWGGNLLGVNGNATNAGAPVVLNAGGTAGALGAPVYNQLVYSAHDYGPSLFGQSWFTSGTCYASGCSAFSLADTWKKYWAYITLPSGVDPVWPGHDAYPWGNTGHGPVPQAPMFIGEFGTSNQDADVVSTGAGSQGQWIASMVNFIRSSYAQTRTALNDSGIPVSDLHWAYWALNEEDSYSVLSSNYSGLRNPRKQYSLLCFMQLGALAVPAGSGPGQCGSTGPLATPDTTQMTAVVMPAPAPPVAGGSAPPASSQPPSPPPTVAPPVAAAPPVAPVPVPVAVPVAPRDAVLSVWWPVNGASLSGTQPFKARLDGVDLSVYHMYWQVDHDRLNFMANNDAEGPHKEASVAFDAWTWRGRGPYDVTFVAMDRQNTVVAQRSVTIYVSR